MAAKKHNIRLIPACRLDLLDGPSLLAYPTDRDAYGRLSTLLTIGNRRAEKGQCHLNKADVYAHAKGMAFIAVPPDKLTDSFALEADYVRHITEYREALGSHLGLGAARTYTGDDAKKLFRIQQLCKTLDMPRSEEHTSELQSLMRISYAVFCLKKKKHKTRQKNKN